jgi:hypothetical protein
MYFLFILTTYCEPIKLQAFKNVILFVMKVIVQATSLIVKECPSLSLVSNAGNIDSTLLQIRITV